MKYLGYSITGAYFSKILGTYELELHETIGNLGRFKFDCAVVVGVGEGYYAAGLSAHLKVPVVAYERKTEAKEALERLGNLNDLQQLEFRGECWPNSLLQLSNAFVLMDIEGEEIEFLNAGVFEQSQGCYWIIEIHGNEAKKLFLEQIGDRYETSFISCTQRKMEDFPISIGGFRKWIFKRYWFSLMQEWRSGGSNGSIGWLILKPKSSKL
ncbi:MAG: hypothetical protein ABJG78_10215 [Cyclobacteriaceae bacterium]